jgi:hypothetical protein
MSKLNNSFINFYNIYDKCYQSTSLFDESEKLFAEVGSISDPLRCTNLMGPISALNNNDFRIGFKINHTLPWYPCTDVNIFLFSLLD